MSIDNLIVSTVNQCFSKYLYEELVVGQLACTEFKNAKNIGEEVDVIMPVSVNLFGYTGGDLPDPEETDVSIAKVKMNKGYGVHFLVKELKKMQIENAPDLKQKVELAKEYGLDAVKQAAAAVDSAYANLYTRAGHYLSDTGGSSIEVDRDNADGILAMMKTKFERGDGKNHTSWVDGEMVAVVPPEFCFHLGMSKNWVYTETGQKTLSKGFIGHYKGWDILSSNKIAQVEDNVFMPMFGRRKKTLAGGVGKDLSIIPYVPEKRFDKAYKGYGYFGVGAPRADFLGTAKISCPVSLMKKAA